MSVESQTKLLDIAPEPIFVTDILLPPHVHTLEKVGKNKICHLFQGLELKKVSVHPTAVKKTYELMTADGVSFYVHLSGSRRNIGGQGTLQAPDIDDITTLDKTIKLQWIHFGFPTENDPDMIVESWRNQFKFKNEHPETGVLGLRKPQAGAIHAISAHWSVSSGTGTVVMPTGTGKTETMLSTIINSQCNKTLVVVPSRTLRKQLYEKFLGLGKLREIGVIENAVNNPRVAIIEHGIKTAKEAGQLSKRANVLITTAAAMSNAPDQVLEKLAEECSHLFFDEAHHTPASSWSRIKLAFSSKHVLQFTATPFRRDTQPIEGKIIYNYPLGMAQKEGYFKKINLVKLQEFDDEVADHKIAEYAIATLITDLANDNQHIIMARCKSKERAKELIKIYEELAPEYNPKRIDSELSASKYRDIESELRNGTTRIIVCVDMLGEGFDLPNLKIAAIHDSHKSLAVTLQFVGRFTRTDQQVGDATMVVNVSEPVVSKDLEELYSEDPDWNEILKEKSESTIETEVESHEFIGQFSGELSEHVSLWNLRPSFSTLVYDVAATSWKPKDFIKSLPKHYKYWFAVNETRKVLVFVISKDDEVKWGRYRDIFNHNFELCVVYWDEEKGAVYVGCSDYSAIDIGKLTNSIFGDTISVKNGAQVFNIYSGIDRPLARNLGVSRLGNISYTMHFGSDVTTGMSSIDRAEGSLNNVYAWGYENGNRFDGGCSSRSGKIWSVGGGPIIEWIAWCKGVGEKVFDEALPDSEIIKDFLKPVRIEKRYEAVPLSAQWSENILKSNETNVTIIIGNDEYKLFEVDLELTKHDNSGDIEFKVISPDKEVKFKIGYSPSGATYTKLEGGDVFIQRGRNNTKLEEYVQKDPIVIFYTDGSYTWNNFHVPTPTLSNYYDKSKLNPIDWSGINKKHESMGKTVEQNTVQYRALEQIIDDYEIVFNDDASGEAADLVAIRKDDNNTLRLRLIHCKYTKTNDKGSRVDDFYELCGQAQKSIRWKHNGFEYLYQHMKKREMKWTSEGYTRFLKGNMGTLNKLRKFARYAPKFEFEVTLVQPGLDSARISEDVIQLLGSTEDYLVTTSGASMEVICS